MNDPQQPINEPKVTPQQPTGSIPVAGQDISINQGSVSVSNQSSSPDDLIKGLDKAADTGVFRPPQDEQSSR